MFEVALVPTCDIKSCLSFIFLPLHYKLLDKLFIRGVVDPRRDRFYFWLANVLSTVVDRLSVVVTFPQEVSLLIRKLYRLS